MSFYDESGVIVEDSSIRVTLDRSVVESDIGITEPPINRALVSVESKMDHFKLVDYFLGQGIPKSISNLLIKEVNLSRSKK